MTKLIMLGGFLGAGKTTTLSVAAKQLAAAGKKVGIITNDQASELVDTVFLSSTGSVTEEVSGSCFCCNFPGFASAVMSLCEQGADVILAEPVGSCTDLSATIMQPLKENFSDKLSIAPLSVLADATRIQAILKDETSGLHESAAYIVRKQLEEADYIIINKTDLLTADEVADLVSAANTAYPKALVYTICAQEEKNIDLWLEKAQAEEAAGTHILEDIDYDTYAEGEAVLGWLNATIECCGKDVDWSDYIAELMSNLSAHFDENDQAVGHVKALIAESNNMIIANLVGNGSTLKIRGTSNKDEKVTLTLNARVQTSPEDLEKTVRKILTDTASDHVTTDITVLKCLMPGRPNPTYRYNHVV